MSRPTAPLRFSLVLISVALIAACGFLYLASLESAQSWPELAHLRVPVFLAVVLGLVPVAMAIASAFALLGLVDRGEELSARGVQLVRRIRTLLGVVAGYLALGLVGFRLVTGLMHVSLMFAWFVLEVATLFAIAGTSWLARVLDDAREASRDVGPAPHG